MKRQEMNAEDVFTGLLEGRIPFRTDGIKPNTYAKMLIEAIRFHEDRMNEAKCEEACHAGWLNCLQESIEEDLLQGREPGEDDLMIANQLPDDIVFCQEQYCVAKAMMVQCESELLRLLEKHPELKDKRRR